MTYKDIIFFIKVSAEYVTSENLLLNSLWERERKRERKTEEERESMIQMKQFFDQLISNH